MTDSNFTAGAHESKQNHFKGALNTQEVLTTLFEVAKDKLSLKDLYGLSTLSEAAEVELYYLEHAIEGLACLVSGDTVENKNGIVCGSFQTADSTAGLLFLIQNNLSHIRGMLQVSSAAEHSLTGLYAYNLSHPA